MKIGIQNKTLLLHDYIYIQYGQELLTVQATFPNIFALSYLQGKHFSIKYSPFKRNKTQYNLTRRGILTKNKIHINRLLPRTEIYGLLMYHISLINDIQTKLNQYWNDERESGYKLKLIQSLYFGILSAKSCFQNGCFSNFRQRRWGSSLLGLRT